MAKMGRPRVEIDKKLFENLCAIMCTEEEIAGMFDCCIDTVNNWCKRTYNATFSDTYKIYSAKGRSSLRRLQYQSAQSGSVPMQIWLGKNWLGQKDQIETTAPETAINIQVSPATADDIEEI